MNTQHPATPAPKYEAAQTEAKWQAVWAKAEAFKAEPNPAKPKYYVLEMLPYPSGVLHIGHTRNYSIGDVLSRFKRAKGFNVMHPMGWDAFGLPAENAALKQKKHPEKWTLENIAIMKQTLQRFGYGYDWSKEVATCLPEYYGPQQALFLDLHAKGLVYRGEALVNWDPIDQTVLANEQVVDGKGWRSGAAVERRKMPQWFMKITNYAEELLADLDKLPNWPTRVKTMQENWLGKSRGLQFSFKVKGASTPLSVFTTRPETIYGATFCAIAPEHSLALQAAQTDPQARLFIEEAGRLGTTQETIDKAEKKGHQTHFVAIHPLTGAELPIYIANFVLMTYGTGAIMSVPAHDDRDNAFALKYNLPITQVIDEHNTLINSATLNGQTIEVAQGTIIAQAEAEGWGKGVTQWRLRDWGIGRQRYWGAPIPFIHCEKCGIVPVPREALPVTLPKDVEFTGSGNPLANHPTWKHTTCPTCQAKAVRETDTMDTFTDSSWYFLRYLCPESPEPLDKQKVQYWMTNPQGQAGVDQYIGGIEHAVLHLLYARFFTKALRDCGYLTFDEPFAALLCQGMLLGPSYKAPNGDYINPIDVIMKDGKATHAKTGEELSIQREEKLSKSKNNAAPLDHLVEKYGVDALRVAVLFLGPVDKDAEFAETAAEGASRFLHRVWALVHKVQALPASGAEDKTLKRKIHQTIRKVTDDIEKFHYNTMVAACMELLNDLTKPAAENSPQTLREGTEALLRLLNPAAPHITEELWSILHGVKGQSPSDGDSRHCEPKARQSPFPMLCQTPWPEYDPAAAQAEEFTLVVQINGKLRARLTVPATITEAEALEAAKLAPEAQSWLQNQTIQKAIYIPGRLVNFTTT